MCEELFPIHSKKQGKNENIERVECQKSLKRWRRIFYAYSACVREKRHHLRGAESLSLCLLYFLTTWNILILITIYYAHVSQRQIIHRFAYIFILLYFYLLLLISLSSSSPPFPSLLTYKVTKILVCYLWLIWDIVVVLCT